MNILLLGEYSNLHWTLAEGLRQLGHKVTVASDGDGFKNYKRDIDLVRKSSSIKDTLSTIASVIGNLKNFKGYDVVQLINPCFTQLNIRANKYLYNYIRKNNQKVFLGAFGVDSFWLRACLDKKTFRYSEFFINGEENPISDNEALKALWLNSPYESLNKEIAETCDGIISCLYEYYIPYKAQHNSKLTYIPLPINTDKIKVAESTNNENVSFFIGINKARSQFKGTDKLLTGLLEVSQKYPDITDISVAESVEYSEYIKMLENSDVVLDQLYSYTPAMNGLISMAMGKVLVGGAEPEMYEFLNEKSNMPIINVLPSDKDIFEKLEHIILTKSNLPSVKENSRAFVETHHNYIKVAQQYVDFWTKTN
ncbi:glycosyltransferase family 1 protein [Dysgonomonas sp. 216]|uniref:glycosyltransferase n=1 Tax=Dysgonomonas sp. 216 TaxID=2302934 RepID=UPI0013CF5A83|nr:glycosyltransferase family 4 protein [Dysgonomonas sp. 216]NDW18064.1 glycosyltransferase family 1 protein [Dysgonomonas sp. 216]